MITPIFYFKGLAKNLKREIQARREVEWQDELDLSKEMKVI